MPTKGKKGKGGDHEQGATGGGGTVLGGGGSFGKGKGKGKGKHGGEAFSFSPPKSSSPPFPAKLREHLEDSPSSSPGKSGDEMEFNMEEVMKALDPATVMKNLPQEVQRRVRALKLIHQNYTKLHEQYQRDMLELYKKYELQYQPLFEKRKSIVTGEVEPKDDELAPEEEEKKDEKDKTEPKKEEEKKEEKKDEKKEPVKGIPNFWAHALLNHELIGEEITENDHKVLEFLTDIRGSYLDEKMKSFKLEFFFSENPFFTNTVLTKTYHVLENDAYTDSDFDKIEGCEIHWKPGKNVTVTEEKKKQRKKTGGKQQVRVVIQKVPCESFFNFFSPPQVPGEDDEIEEEEYDEITSQLNRDLESGAVIMQKIIPNAVKWFTGEAVPFSLSDLDFIGSGDDEDEDDEDEDEEDEESEEDHPVRPTKRGGKAKSKEGSPPKPQAPTETPTECKQQ